MQISQDQRDRLRVFVLNEVEQLRRIRLAGEIKGADLQRGGQSSNDLVAFCGPSARLEEFLRVLDPALSDVLMGEHEFVELFVQHFCSSVDVHPLKLAISSVN